MSAILQNNARRMAALLCTAALFLFFGNNSVLAHARLIKSNPADKAELKQSPDKIELWFNELLDDGFNSIEVFSAAELQSKARTNFSKRKPWVDPDDRTHLIIALETLKPGDYVVDYRVLSRDGHAAPGRVTFKLVETK